VVIDALPANDLDAVLHRGTARDERCLAKRGDGVRTSEDGTCPHGISDPAWCAFCKAGHGPGEPGALYMVVATIALDPDKIEAGLAGGQKAGAA
jgi:hypothetical protein